MPIARAPILQLLQTSLPGLLAVHAFGSRISGQATATSDLDLAVLVAGYADPLQLWQLSSALAELAGCEVDLLDLRAASTVMQYQILSTGERWWAADVQADLFEAAILSEKTALDAAHAGPLDDIRKQKGGTKDEFLLRNAANIGRYVLRAREEYLRDPASFSADFTRQDAAILNIQRACEAALDMGQHLIRRERLGIPQSARDVFSLLAQAGWIEAALAEGLKRMVGFRNIAVHDYQSLQMPITISIIQNHLDEFLQFSQTILLRDASRP